MQDQKLIRRQKLRFRIRRKIHGTAIKPRLSVYRSNKDIYAQLIDDDNSVTLASASSRGKKLSGNKVDQAFEVGKLIADAAKSKNIENCVFDRGGYLYHGRIKSLADGAREGGLKF